MALRLAAAQSISLPGDVAANAAVHERFVAAAHEAAVDVLVFPELSLSGYELPRLAECQLLPDAAVLAPLRARAVGAGMTVVVGAPVASGGALPAIGALAFHRDGSTSIYRKQHLHGDEVKYAAAGEPGVRCHAQGDESFALAICADTTHAEHAAAAAAAGASLYLAGVLVTPEGYAPDAEAWRRYAADHRMGVLIANHGGRSGNWESAGRSAFWAPGGRLVAAAAGTGSCLVIATLGRGEWSGEVRPV